MMTWCYVLELICSGSGLMLLDHNPSSHPFCQQNLKVAYTLAFITCVYFHNGGSHIYMLKITCTTLLNHFNKLFAVPFKIFENKNTDKKTYNCSRPIFVQYPLHTKDSAFISCAFIKAVLHQKKQSW